MKILSNYINLCKHRKEYFWLWKYNIYILKKFCSLDVEFLVKRHYKGKLPDELAITILR